MAQTEPRPSTISRTVSRASRIGAALTALGPTDAHFDVLNRPDSPHCSWSHGSYPHWRDRTAREGMVGREVDEHGGNGHGDRDGDGDAERGDGEGDEVGGRGEDEPMSDIEHVPCEDDPREWSDGKKNLVLAMMTTAVLGPLIAPSIYNPVIDDIKADLRASDTQIGLSLSMYILLQGWMPVVWASIAEIIGRKIVYLVSYAIYTIAAIIAGRASNMPILIGMRCIQAMGSAAVVAIGAGSLADMFEVHERGQKLGLFYGMPLLGPAIGPLIGGALGNSFGWRSSLYFLAAFAGLVDFMFVFFPDTWRKERSRAYQKAIQNAIRRALQHDEAIERKRQRKLARGIRSNAPTPPLTQPPTPGPLTRRASEVATTLGKSAHGGSMPANADVARTEKKIVLDTERQTFVVNRKRRWNFPCLKRETNTTSDQAEIRPGIRDVNPLPAMASIFKSPTNGIILFSSGLLFSAQYTIPYTASVTLAKAPYNYNALYIGLVILSFGVGSITGSLVGGRYSDKVLRSLKKANGGVTIPEMRLRSTIVAMPLIVASFLTYAWTAGEHVHVAGIIVSLCFCGLSLMLIYSSTLAYLVDANPGRSASAVSCNSFVRGSFGCILSQVAIPLQKSIGDGGLYTLMAGLLMISSGGILLVIWKGETWRSPTHRWFWQSQRKNEGISGQQ